MFSTAFYNVSLFTDFSTLSSETVYKHLLVRSQNTQGLSTYFTEFNYKY